MRMMLVQGSSRVIPESRIKGKECVEVDVCAVKGSCGERRFNRVLML